MQAKLLRVVTCRQMMLTNHAKVELALTADDRTPFMNISYHSTHGPLVETGLRPPNTRYLRGFEA